MIDKNLKAPYTSGKNLENGIKEAMPVMKGADYMARQRVYVTLPNGEQVWITGATYSDLIRNALNKYSDIEDKRKQITFKEYTDQIFDVFLKPRWKDTTAGTNLFLLDKHLLPYFKDFPIDRIDTIAIQRFFQKKQHLSKSYTKQMLILLHEIMENAVEDHLIRSDPTLSKRITLPEKVTKRKALEPEQFRDVVSHISSLSGEDAIFLALLCFTGMRRGEILGLKWANVLKGKIQIRSEVTFKSNTAIYHEYTKSASGIRDIPIPKELEPYLTNRGKGFVIGGSKPYTQCKMARMWERIAKRINLYNATPHTFRHTYLSILAASNVDPKTIQALAGHSDFSFTFNKYIDKNKLNIHNAGNRLSDFIDGSKN